MLSSSGRQRLKTLFLEISRQELSLEVLRQILGEQYDFEPYAAFRRIDRKRKGFITSVDIQEFLLEHEHRVLERDAANYIDRYDLNGDGNLNYHEFLPSLLPLDNADLRTIVTQRKVYDIQIDEFLSYEVEYALARLLMREISYFRETEDFKLTLVEDYSFMFGDAFALIDIDNVGYIDFVNLKNFLSREGKEPTDETVITIIRRLDKDDDGRLNFDEFVEGLRPRDPGLQDLVGHKLKPRVIQKDDYMSLSRREKDEYITQSRRSSLRKSRAIYNPFETKETLASPRSRHTSPSRNELLSPSSKKVFTSPLRTTAPGSHVRRAEYYSSPKAYTRDTNLETKRSNKVSSIKKRTSSALSGKKRDIVKQAHSDELAQTIREADWLRDLMRIFREIINLEKEIEVAKEDLCIRKDFNLFDAFRIFDKKAFGSITVGDVEEGLAELDIYPNRDDLYLFVRRFDRDADGRLRFSDFCEALTPNQAEYYKMVRTRTPINADNFFNIRQAFTEETIKLLRRVFLNHMENEAIVETLRQKVERSPHFNPRKAFEIIDQDGDGYISTLDFRIAMDREDVFVTEKDIRYLFNRLDKDEDEVINFVEFVQEITPKSHKQY